MIQLTNSPTKRKDKADEFDKASRKDSFNSSQRCDDFQSNDEKFLDRTAQKIFEPNRTKSKLKSSICFKMVSKYQNENKN